MANDKVVKTISIDSRGFYCETCVRQSVSTNTTIRFYKSGVEVQVDHCANCKREQTTEYFNGPQVRIQNKPEEK